MTEKELLKKKIQQYDFSILEAELYLDTHPTCQKALSILKEFKVQRADLIKNFEERFGDYAVTKESTNAENYWKWIDSPWPWEIKEENS